MPRLVAMLFASTLLLAPLCARAADLVVWWEEGQYAEEDEAVLTNFIRSASASSTPRGIAPTMTRPR
jgi:hypothetical protein